MLSDAGVFRIKYVIILQGKALNMIDIAKVKVQKIISLKYHTFQLFKDNMHFYISTFGILTSIELYIIFNNSILKYTL